MWDLPLARLCNFIWYMMTRNSEKADIDQLRAKLWIPPKGAPIPAQSPWSADNETKAFAAVKAMVASG